MEHLALFFLILRRAADLAVQQTATPADKDAAANLRIEASAGSSHNKSSFHHPLKPTDETLIVGPVPHTNLQRVFYYFAELLPPHLLVQTVPKFPVPKNSAAVLSADNHHSTARTRSFPQERLILFHQSELLLHLVLL